jgi:hypothetical protein
MALTRTSLQALLDVDQPLRKVYELEYKDPDIEIGQIFNVENMNGAEEKDLTTHGVGALEDVGEAGAVPYDDPGLGYSTVYAYRTFKKGIEITKQMAQDNKYRQMKNMMAPLAQRASYDPVNYAYGLFRNAFTANPTGYGNYNAGALPLGSGSQTYEDGSSGTLSNYSTNTLNYDNFELRTIAMTEHETGHGTLIAYRGPLTLLVPPALRREALEITESDLDPDTAENAINVYKGGVARVVVCPFISTAAGGSDTAWFLIAPGHKLNFFWRNKPVLENKVDFDTGVNKYKVEVEYVCGFSDWRATDCNDGTV